MKFGASNITITKFPRPLARKDLNIRVIASYLLQKIQTKREKYSVKKKQSSKRRKGYYLKKVSE
jgi:hypothetical protein